MIYYGYWPDEKVIWLPVFILITIVSALSLGIWLSAITIRYRDFQHVVPFLIQVGLFATPIAYPSQMIPEQYKMFYFLNPMAGVVEGFRWCLVGGATPDLYYLISFSVIAILFVTSIIYFKKVERYMADIV